MRKITFPQTINWRDFSLGYLKASEACADEFIRHIKNQDQLRKKTHETYARFCFIPAIWNLKHAFELTIKYLSKRLDPKDRRTHDLQYLLQEFQKDAGLTDGEIEDLNGMYEKYIKLEPLRNLITKQKNPDTSKLFQLPNDKKNMFFHYPEGHPVHGRYERFCYYSLIVDEICEKKMVSIMEDLKKDAREFSRIFPRLM